MPDTVPLGIPAVELAHRTDPGRDPAKQVNEDAAGCRETTMGHLCVVCDGMGGHEGGREASNLALETIFHVFENPPPRAAGSIVPVGGHPQPPGPLPPSESGRAREILKEAIVQANRKVFDLAQAGAVGHPGSTVVAILVHAWGTEVAHVGDSRCYRVHQGQIQQVTRDHSMVQQLVDAQVLTPEQAAAHPDANKITRALGMTAEVEVEVRATPVPQVAGDVFVLCSDGLSDLVGPADIVRIVATAPAAQAAGQLVDLANARGGHDNISVIVVRARESALVSRALQGDGASPPGHAARQLTEAMAAPTVIDAGGQSAQSGQSGPGAGAVVGAVPGAPRSLVAHPPAGRSYHATTVPITEARRARRAVPAAVIVAIALGLVGLGAAGIALWLVLPHAKGTPRAPFVMPTATQSTQPASGASPTAVSPPLPTATTLPDLQPAVTTTSSEPLPPLLPSPPPPRGRNRRQLE